MKHARTLTWAGYWNAFVKVFCVKVTFMSHGLRARSDTSSTSGLQHYHNRWPTVDFTMELWTSLSSFSPIDVTSSINQALFTNMSSPGCVCPAAAHCKSCASFCVNCKRIRGARGVDETRAVVCGEGWGWSHVYPIYCLSARKEESHRLQMSTGPTVSRCCDLSNRAERIVGLAGAEVQIPLLY